MTESSKPPPGRRMKAHAPPPPRIPQPTPRQIFRNPSPDSGGISGMDAKENMLKPTVELKLTLPQGHQTSVIEDGSKALMDLLVELCSRYHLNPALHTLELLSPEGHSLGFKPNALLGSFNVAAVLIKEKVWEEKVVRRPAPKVPEKTVRLMVNFHGSQKAVLRVNPLVPLKALIPVICEKCEFEPSHVLLLKDGVSRLELPLDKSLSDLGIKELYVHDQALVFQPKMASVPALNYSDSTRSSTTSLGRSEKKSFLGVFQFSRRKSKTDPTSKDMDDCDDKVIQYTDMQSDSTISGISCLEDRTGTLGHSQSDMSIPRSPKSDAKKRRAPVPPGTLKPSMGDTSYESFQMSLGSESMQRKRKAPAPPPTPTSVTQGSDDASASSAPTPDSFETETPVPALFIRVAQSTGVSAPTVVTQTTKPAPIKVAVKPLRVYDDAPARSSPTPSSSTADSLAAQDSSSELSHSLDDSDADQYQTGSHCSTLTSSSASGSVQVLPTAERFSTKVEKSVSGVTAQLNEEEASDSSSRSETESALNLKLEEVENSRHSAIAWLHSTHRSAAKGQKLATEDETLSLSSSTGSSSLPDHGYAASEGTGEDSGVVSSMSDNLPTSPDWSFSPDVTSVSRGGKLSGAPQDSFSDSDEGCATWGSIHRHSEVSLKATELAGLKDNYYDHKLTSQLNQTLADFEVDLAGHFDVVSAKETTHAVFMVRNQVPVSVVDMDVPVTAIDEVIDEYECRTVEPKGKSFTRTESASSQGSESDQKSNMEPQNKNNNAYTAAVNSKKSVIYEKLFCQSEQNGKQHESKSVSVERQDKVIKTKMNKSTAAHAKKVKEDKQTSAVKSSVDVQRNKSTKSSPDPVERTSQKKADLPHPVQRSVSTKKDENLQQNTPITRNVTSRFGMKTFTVVPPKPAVKHTDPEQPAVRTTTGAIRIDDQGNMVKSGISWNKSGGSSESENTPRKDSTLGKAKAFWSSSEKQESVHNKDLLEKPKESTNNLKTAPAAVLETTLKTYGTEQLQTTQSAVPRITERVQSEVIVREVAEDVKVAKNEQFEADSKISVSKSFQPPSNKPAVAPSSRPDQSRDLSFLKPSRRTSSQYVASAISKYSPTSSAKPNSLPKSPDFSTGFQRSGRPIQENPRQNPQSFFSESKENVSVLTSQSPGPTRSPSYPEFMSESQRDSGEARRDRAEVQNRLKSTKESSHRLETDGAKTTHTHFSETTQIKVTNHHDGDHGRRVRSPSPAGNGFPHSSTKLSTAPKVVIRGPTTSSSSTVKTAPHVSANVKPQASVTVSDSGVTSGPPAVTLFGPITKFRPVIHKAVEKETSLHSSLMEAIQTSGGVDRLKKVSASGSSSLKKGPYVEEENERSALLAAIRAQNSTSRLKKTKSVAANELEKFKKVASEEERHLGPSSSSSSSSTSSSSTSVLTYNSHFFNSPPPEAPMVAPPPPPFVLPQAKPSSVAYPSANTSMNPALAREAMLEAIRSGSAADKLKKVASPRKTVQVNGRLGTIQATSKTTRQ
ncbi:unnamed protein product [Ophioblennius macclurei]